MVRGTYMSFKVLNADVHTLDHEEEIVFEHQVIARMIEHPSCIVELLEIL